MRKFKALNWMLLASCGMLGVVTVSPSLYTAYSKSKPKKTPTHVNHHQSHHAKSVKSYKQHAERIRKSKANYTTTSHKRLSEQKLATMEQTVAWGRTQYYYPNISINTRDLGGYETANGKYMVKPDKLIRSSELTNLNSWNASMLNTQLHVNKIIDLRNAKQIERKPDFDEKKSFTPRNTVKEVRDSVYTAHNFQIIRHRNDKYKYSTLYGFTPQAERAYKYVFMQALKDKDGAILYHCSAGRDRTGIMSALLLSSLGVKRSTVEKDYLLSNYYNPHHETYVQQLQDLQSFFKTVDTKYGNLHNYLNHLGVSNADIHQLRKTYLEPVL